MNVVNNSYSTHKKRYVLFFGLITLLIGNQTWASVADVHDALSVEAVVNQTNLARAEYGLLPLVQDPRLVAAAQEKANKMAQFSEFSHRLSDGTTGWSLLSTYNYCYKHAAENLALFYTDAESVVDAWMNSPLHRRNLLSNHAQDIGIGIAVMRWSGYEGYVVVQALAAESIMYPKNAVGCVDYQLAF